MIILPCLEFLFFGGYITYIFLLLFVFLLIFKILHFVR